MLLQLIQVYKGTRPGMDHDLPRFFEANFPRHRGIVGNYNKTIWANLGQLPRFSDSAVTAVTAVNQGH